MRGCWHDENESVASQHVFILNKTLRKNDKSPLKKQQQNNNFTINPTTKHCSARSPSTRPTDPMMHQVTRPVLDFPTLAMQCSAVRHHWSDTLKSLESHHHQWTKSTTFPQKLLQAKNSSKSSLLVSLFMEMWR